MRRFSAPWFRHGFGCLAHSECTDKGVCFQLSASRRERTFPTAGNKVGLAGRSRRSLQCGSTGNIECQISGPNHRQQQFYTVLTNQKALCGPTFLMHGNKDLQDKRADCSRGGRRQVGGAFISRVAQSPWHAMRRHQSRPSLPQASHLH